MPDSLSQIPALSFPPRRPTPHDEGRNIALPLFLLVPARAGPQRTSGRGARRRRALKQGSALICSSPETSLAPGWVRSTAGVENPPRGCGCPGGRAWRGEEVGLWPGAAGRQMTEGNGQIQGRPSSPPLPALGAGRRMRLLYVGHGLQRGEALREREIPAPKESLGQAGNRRLVLSSRAQRWRPFTPLPPHTPTPPHPFTADLFWEKSSRWGSPCPRPWGGQDVRSTPVTLAQKTKTRWIFSQQGH